MTHALRLQNKTASSVKSLLFATTLALFAPTAQPVDLPFDDGIYRGEHEALGISDEFGRWNGTIRLVYDPDGAPAAYASSAKVLALLAEAFDAWTAVSGVEYEISGIDATVPDDRNASTYDGRVRVSWGSIGGAAGRAGPFGSFYDSDLGYFPYEDGSIELSNDADAIESDSDLVSVLIHEIGHLLGFGHSDNPDSVMFANPYNFLRYPRADDIRAAQVLYGAPASAIDAGSPLPAWTYSPPPNASAATTQFMFKPHAFASSGAFFSIGAQTVTSVTGSAPDADFVMFVGALGGLGSPPIDVAAAFVVVDPYGYVYSERDMDLECPASNGCQVSASVGQGQILKTVPGAWKVYVVNKATNQTLASATLPVNTTVSYNRPPTATLTATAGTGATVNFTLTATDPENDGIVAVWHPPGLSGFTTDVRNSFESGGSVSRSFNFAQAGTHTFYVEVRDNAARYGDGPNSNAAGEGFQTLLRVTVTLPGAGMQVVSSADAGTATGPTQQTLSAVARTPAPDLVAFANGASVLSNAAVSFRYGASSDQGATVKSTFSTGESIVVAGSVFPLTTDLGRAGEVYMVVRTTIAGVDTWRYRNASGAFIPWPSMALTQLEPAYTVASLKNGEAFEVYSGTLIPAHHRIYIGYRVGGGTTLFYSGTALNLTVN